MLNSNIRNGKFRYLSAPITVHLELTSACNERCRHCYNFWRKDNIKNKSITWQNLRSTIRELESNNVLHVILTGGEPLLTFEKLLYAVKRCVKAGMSVSLNSNLMFVTQQKMLMLKSVGLEHILTSVNSYSDEINDYIANTPGALKEIMKGIKITQEAGIRVTPNMIVSKINKDHVYRTGEFLYKLGVKKFLANRTIPPENFKKNIRDEFIFDKEIARVMFEDLIRLRDDLGMEIGTCRTVPSCFFDDFKKYSVFLGRGCSAGKKHLILNVDGDAHACVHEDKEYGNIHKIGLRGVWGNMRDWRSLSYIPQECQECHLLDLCDGGCRLVAMAYDTKISGRDNLCIGPKDILHYNDGITDEFLKKLETKTFKVKTPLKIRKEDGFYIFRIMGARVAFVEDYLADVLIRFSQDGNNFTIKDVAKEYAHKITMSLLVKEGLIIPANT